MLETDLGLDKWDRHDRLPGGMRIFFRILRPADASLYPDFLAEVSAEDMRLRFFAPMRELRQKVIEQLTRLDPTRATAFVALDEDTDKLLESRVCIMKTERMANTRSWCDRV